MIATCTCGTREPHEIARRRTADDVVVCLYDDGAVTGMLGIGIAGVPVANPRTDEGRQRALAAGWMFAGEVSLYDADEIGALYAACRWAADRGLDVGAMRARLAGSTRPTVRPVWEVYRTDRDGRPTERVWRLPRLRWPGLMVWDTCGAALRYEVMAVDGHDVCTRIGFRFATLAELAAHLDAEKQ